MATATYSIVYHFSKITAFYTAASWACYAFFNATYGTKRTRTSTKYTLNHTQNQNLSFYSFSYSISNIYRGFNFSVHVLAYEKRGDCMEWGNDSNESFFQYNN